MSDSYLGARLREAVAEEQQRVADDQFWPNEVSKVEHERDDARRMRESARAEIERLRAECKRHADNHDQVVGWLREKTTEANETAAALSVAQAENERLRLALRHIAGIARTSPPGLVAHDLDRCGDVAENTLRDSNAS